LIVAAMLAVGVPVLAQKPANAPAKATAQCTDGTFSTAKTEKGACSKHGGVKSWFGPAAAPATPKVEAKKETAKQSGAKKGGSTTTPPPAMAANAPAGSTGQCGDGSYTKAKTQKGACSQHGGVKTWFASDLPANAPNVPAATPNNAPAAAPKTSAAPSPAPDAPRTTAPRTSAPPAKAPASTGKAQVTAKPADAPVDATAKCKDGTYSSSKTHTGACSHHGGVAEWYK